MLPLSVKLQLIHVHNYHMCALENNKKNISICYIYTTSLYYLVGDVAIYNSKESKPEFYILTKRM